MVAVRVKPLVDASLSAMLIGAWVLNPLIEELSIQSARYKTDENAQELLMQKAICLPHLRKSQGSTQPYGASIIAP